ncbi:MAG: 6-pyruvoyl-tetrahydropterin synthase [Rickettsiales bacterium]|jgi:6-pyruvoyltetrahydropterin/6-carboxytetrahydropterin synthase|nr:6-pyruvoyl-tetrahydropterin synthase [Rickettsiales bacterium]
MKPNAPIVYITRRATFSASHRLHSLQLNDEENRALFGKCNRTNGHGHNYTLEVTLRGPVDARTGILMDLTEVKRIIEEVILERVDHRHMNLDVQPFDTVNPTTENMVVVFWKWLEPALPKGLLYEMRLHETENNVAVYRGE